MSTRCERWLIVAAHEDDEAKADCHTKLSIFIMRINLIQIKIMSPIINLIISLTLATYWRNALKLEPYIKLKTQRKQKTFI